MIARVCTSSVIEAPVTEVWTRIRDFNALPDWHPIVAESRIEDGQPSDKVGCVRNFSLKDGGKIRERLLALSDDAPTCTYSILESPMPVTHYVATLTLTEITDGNRTFISWSAEFECPANEAEGLVGFIGTNVFQAGFDSLKQAFGA